MNQAPLLLRNKPVFGKIDAKQKILVLTKILDYTFLSCF